VSSAVAGTSAPGTLSIAENSDREEENLLTTFTRLAPPLYGTFLAVERGPGRRFRGRRLRGLRVFGAFADEWNSLAEANQVHSRD